MKSLTARLLAATAALTVTGAQAREYPIGGPVEVDGMEIASSYLTGIEMAPMPAGMAMGADVVHLETDVHANTDNKQGFANGEWMPYLTIEYTMRKPGTSWSANGKMHAMTAKDGPHYANNVKMDGPGTYQVTLKYISPESNGFLHHVDTATGVPGWWTPVTEHFTFQYPQK